MAIGAIQAMKASGISMDAVVVGGVDATSDALVAMQAGEMDVTVFQDLAGQGAGSIDTAMQAGCGRSCRQDSFHPIQAGHTSEPWRLSVNSFHPFGAPCVRPKHHNHRHFKGVLKRCPIQATARAA